MAGWKEILATGGAAAFMDNKDIYGSKAKTKKETVKSAEQIALNQAIIEGLRKGTGPFADLYGKFNEKEFQEGVANPAIQNYKENILPQIQEQFISGNQALGSGMRRGVLKSGNELQSKLAELLYNAKQGHKQNKIAGIDQAQNFTPFENVHTPAKQGLVQGAVQGLVKGASQAAGAAAVAG